MGSIARFVACLAIVTAAFGAGWVYRGIREWASPVRTVRIPVEREVGDR